MTGFTDIKRLSALWLCVGLIGCATPLPKPADVQRFDRIVHTLADPTMEGRGAGTAGLDRARDYLVEQFQFAGLSPGFVEDSFTQALEISLCIEVDEQTLVWTSNGESQVLTGGREEAFNVLGLSAGGAFEGEAVFVGYAITNEEHDYDSLGEADDDALQGRVAIAYRYEPMDEEGQSQWVKGERWTDAAWLVTKARWAQDRGAAALLIVNPPSQDDGSSLSSTRETVGGENVDIPVFHLRRKVFGKMLQAIGRDAESAMRTYEQQADRGAGRVDVLLNLCITGSASLSRPRAMIHNVAAIVPGVGDLAGQTVILGAHYDHLGFGGMGSFASENKLHPGADDNASGTALVLMLAARWQQRITDDLHTNRRTLAFIAFSGEERGLLGSAHLVEHGDELNFDFFKVVAMINCDMVGRMREDELYVMGSGSGKQWLSLMKRANRPPRLALTPTGSPIGPSDHTHFYLAGIPVLHLYTGVHENYHRPTDTPDRINAFGGARVVNFTDNLLAELVYGKPVSYVEVKTTHTSTHAMTTDTSGAGAYLGVLPDYQSMQGREGCGIDHVTPGSPAEAGGLEADDVVIQWNDQSIANLRQFSDALRSASPGDQVVLTVLRKDIKHILHITLGKR